MSRRVALRVIPDEGVDVGEASTAVAAHLVGVELLGPPEPHPRGGHWLRWTVEEGGEEPLCLELVRGGLRPAF